MSLLSRLFPKPEPLPHVIPRYHAATKAENREAARKRISVQLELAVYNATTTKAQRKAEADAYHEQVMRDWPKLRAVYLASTGRKRG